MNAKKGCEIEFIARQMVDKMLDDNPYMPLYVEFLLEKKRNRELDELFEDLKKKTFERFESVDILCINKIFDKSTYDMITNFINTFIIGSDILNARKNFKENRFILEQAVILILKNKKGD